MPLPRSLRPAPPQTRRARSRFPCAAGLLQQRKRPAHIASTIHPAFLSPPLPPLPIMCLSYHPLRPRRPVPPLRTCGPPPPRSSAPCAPSTSPSRRTRFRSPPPLANPATLLILATLPFHATGHPAAPPPLHASQLRSHPLRQSHHLASHCHPIVYPRPQSATQAATPSPTGPQPIAAAPPSHYVAQRGQRRWRRQRISRAVLSKRPSRPRILAQSRLAKRK